MAEEWERLKQLFNEALELEPEARVRFLAKACAGQDALREEVESLLAHHGAGGFTDLVRTHVQGLAMARGATGDSPETSPTEATATTAATQRLGATAENGLPMEQTLPSQGDAAALDRGSTLGRYTVLKKLGGGGMGVVYMAHDSELDRKVALKLLRPEMVEALKGEGARGRLLREAQAMARLSHPNVVYVHDVGTLGNRIFIAMEYLPGQTLTRWLKETQRTQREILRVFGDAAKGLAAAHAAGLVHRDFKPDNVLIGPEGQVKVLDFGLARTAEDLEGTAPTLLTPLGADGQATPRVLEAQLTQTGVFLGTPAYMAPEQFLLRKTTDARADQFSFCIALYEALYGERPFAGDNIRALIAEVTQGKLREAPKGSRVPAWLRRLLLTGLRPDPKDRYPSMDALLRELGRDRVIAKKRALAFAGIGLLLAGSALGYRYVSGRSRQIQFKPTFRSAANANAEESKVLAQGRELTSLFYKGETAPIWARMTDQMKEGLKSEEALASGRQLIAAELGEETKVVDEKIVAPFPGYQSYWRIVLFSKSDKRLKIVWSLDDQGRIAGFGVTPELAP